MKDQNLNSKRKRLVDIIARFTQENKSYCLDYKFPRFFCFLIIYRPKIKTLNNINKYNI